jgi:hypothetical protein
VDIFSFSRRQSGSTFHQKADIYKTSSFTSPMDAAGTFTKLDDNTSPEPTRTRVVEEERGKMPELKLCGGGNLSSSKY